MMMSVPAAWTMVVTLATRPVTWLSGTAASDRSASVSPMHRSKTSDECTMPRCVSMAPLGRPVVPEV